MGFVVGLVAAAVGLSGAYFAAEFVSPGLGVAFLALVGLGSGFLMHRFGHRQFRGGGNTDFWLFFMVFGISLALAIPRYNRARSCEVLQDYATWLQGAQTEFHLANGKFAGTDRELAAFSGEPAPASADGIRISLDSLAVDLFSATLTHEMCPKPLSVQLGIPAPSSESEPGRSPSGGTR